MKNELSSLAIQSLTARIVRALVLIAAGIVLAGGIWYLVKHGQSLTEYRFFEPDSPELHNAAGILHSVFSAHSRGLIQLGIVILLTIPLVRLLLHLLTFVRQRDWLYTVLTLAVLSVLLFSFLR